MRVNDIVVALAAAQRIHQGKTPRDQRTWRALFFVGALIYSGTKVAADEWSGQVGLEYRGFTEAPLDDAQHRNYFSVSAQPEYRRKWDGGAQSAAFVPFVRVAPSDDERSHADIRELAWIKVGSAHEWRVGVRKVFWGVTESQHLVDIVNQTDLVENPDAEEKLGQPMINLALIGNWGTLDLYALTGFRERTFPGREGRLRTAPAVASDRAQYESGRGRERVDLAARWHRSRGNWDIGISQFAGTARDPRLIPALGDDGAPVLIPYYELIAQTGLDVQATRGAWLWKLEAIHRDGQGRGYAAATGGLEYTLSGVAGTGMDLGLLAEYLYDDRGDAAPTPFQNDVFLGMRLGVNDERGTEALLGAFIDRASHARLLSLEASGRIGGGFKLTAEARAFVAVPETDLLYMQRRDDYVQLEIAYHF